MIVAWTLAGALVGTLVLSTAMRLGAALRWTRIDLPFLLGTMVTGNRARAKLLGWALHAGAGLGFGLVYAGIFAASGTSGWWVGALLGLLHGVVATTAVAEIAVPLAHRGVGTSSTTADRTPLLGPPGFLMLNYGRATPALTVAAHVAYGAIVGGFASLA